MKKESGKQFPIKNTFTYPSGKSEVVMAKSKPAQDNLEDDMRKIINSTEVKIVHKKEFFWQYSPKKPMGAMV